MTSTSVSTGANGVNFCDTFGGIISIVALILKVVQWVVPIILLILGSIDLTKAVIAGKEDDIKKNQNLLIKRIIIAVIVFLVPLIVTTIMGLIGQEGWRECWNDNAPNPIQSLFGTDSIGK